MTENHKKCGLGNDNSELILNGIDDETTNSQDNIKTNEQPPSQSESEILGKTLEAKATSKIEVIRSEVEHIKDEMLSVRKETLQSDFKKYEEVLILKTIELDYIETYGIEELREARKYAIQFVQQCLQLLDELVEEQIINNATTQTHQSEDTL